jgi:hypothetical protein
MNMTNSNLKMLTKNQTVILGHNVLAKWDDTKIIEYIGKLKTRSQRQQKYHITRLQTIGF